VRRIVQQSKFSNFHSAEATTTYAPEIDGNIPDKMLLFDPPKRKYRTKALSHEAIERYNQRELDRNDELSWEDERKFEAVEEKRKHK